MDKWKKAVLYIFRVINVKGGGQKIIVIMDMYFETQVCERDKCDSGRQRKFARSFRILLSKEREDNNKRYPSTH